nr:hypothetical protein Iba_chr05eCG14960 [Ipomoea batatas]GMD84616.1 hypothetical protein Iba_chr14aCG16460 [Ipomoea batatas]
MLSIAIIRRRLHLEQPVNFLALQLSLLIYPLNLLDLVFIPQALGLPVEAHPQPPTR